MRKKTLPYICGTITNTNTMTYKKQLEMEMMEMSSVINHFENGNEVVISRWTERFGYTLEMIVNEFNELVDTYNRKYGKRFGCCKKKSVK